ncbi:hypothetical protein A9D66_12330 [Xanthomonas citri pv. glycines str. 12-2]|nr:hypothetical protein A9D66_12330 [Xanthomonas citri pv. glycines str. 12-2]
MVSRESDLETIADANLIAAAPALLAAATAMIEVEQTVFGSPEQATYSERYAAAVDSLRAAIAQAQGTTV